MFGIFDQTAVGHFPFLHPFRNRLVKQMVDMGATEADATAAVGKIGDGHLLQLLLTYGPTIYALAQVVCLMFGIVLPPLPVIPPAPTPPAPAA